MKIPTHYLKHKISTENKLKLKAKPGTVYAVSRDTGEFFRVSRQLAKRMRRTKLYLLVKASK